jgi:hypothetical protein
MKYSTLPATLHQILDERYEPGIGVTAQPPHGIIQKEAAQTYQAASVL